ncbi:MAG TPA: hypothetical protein PLD88_04645 [Candidatus Berkiella sp.]|nr:hypothetical protein [Candidatus Berkiella sp.]
MIALAFLASPGLVYTDDAPQNEDRKSVTPVDVTEDDARKIAKLRQLARDRAEQARQEAHEEGLRIIQQAHAEVEHMTLQAKENLRKQVAGIAIAGAEKILGSTIDADIHQNMLDKLAQEI